MKAHVIIIFSLAVLIGMPNVSAQSFKDKLKKKTEKIVKQKVEKQVKTGASKKVSSKKSNTTLKQQSSKIVSIGTLPISLQNHTALFAPVIVGKNKAIDAKWGIRSVKAEMPPKEETKQVGWNDSRAWLYEMDNKSIVDEFLIMHKCIETGYFAPTSPAALRYFEVKGELWDRVEALDRMVELYNEFKEDYANGDSFAERESELMESHLGFGEYQRAIRSSIEPFFLVYTMEINNEEVKYKFAMDKTKEYFEAHGGYQNAHKGKFTVWNPYHHY